ncbi:MAG: 6-bladed beta-propeller [Acidobacteriota bacterium]
MKFDNVKKAKALITLIFLGALLLIFFSGSLANIVADNRDSSELYWPAAPDTPRIKYLNSIASPKDLKLKQSSFLKRLVKKIVGFEETDAFLVSPYGVTTDSHNRLIVADPKARCVHVFDAQEKKYFSIKEPSNKDPFISVVAVAIDAEDNIYAADSASGKIFIFNRDGKFQKRLGADEGMFNRPSGIAIDKQTRRLYVVETVKGEVDVLTLEGTGLFKFGKRGAGEGEFNYPTHICIKGDRVLITDTFNARIQIFNKDGKFISTLGRRGDGYGDLDKPKGVAMDSAGHIYVVEGLHDVVNIYDRDGSFLMAFGETGSHRGEFYLPTAIHIDADDNVYVADSYNRRIQVFKYLKESNATRK